MNIGKKHRLISDPLNFILQKKVITKNGDNAGKERWVNIGYFAEPKNALKTLADNKLRESDITNFKAIVKKQAEIYSLIESLNIPSTIPEKL